MDELDKAQVQEMAARDFAVKQAQFKPEQEACYDEQGLRICMDCGVSIPELRILAVDAVRCVDCQQVAEIKGRVHL